MQYYEYQIVLVAMRKTRRSAGSEGSTNIKPRLYLCGKRGNLQDHGVLRILTRWADNSKKLPPFLAFCRYRFFSKKKENIHNSLVTISVVLRKYEMCI